MDGRDGVFVTGAGGGIGAAVVHRLVADGYPVAAADIDADAATKVADAATGPGAATAVQVDTADLASVEAALDAAESAIGPLSFAVTAAGVIRKQEFFDLDLTSWQRTLDVNLTGTWLVLQRMAERMVAGNRAGALVAISSVAGRGGRANAVDYAASKAAVISVVRSAALALGGHGIRVNAVCPGVVDTPMTDAIHEQTAAELGITTEESLRRMVATIPLGRLEQPSEVASTIAFLLSDDAAYVTGQALNVCGGLELD